MLRYKNRAFFFPGDRAEPLPIPDEFNITPCYDEERGFFYFIVWVDIRNADYTGWRYGRMIRLTDTPSRVEIILTQCRLALSRYREQVKVK